ncbi:MAG: RDD family protein [Acidobacteriaceae bacterium]|nr:RDD family protein [Acidobacteriaceae bacterium]
MNGAAQHNEFAGNEELLLTGTDGAAAPHSPNSALKQAVAERLAAHRHRRAQEQALLEDHEMRATQARKESRRGSSSVSDAVKARYERSQSYREFLAAEAERAVQQAQAEAEIAAMKMAAIAEAQQKLMDELASYEQPGPILLEEVPVRAEAVVPMPPVAAAAAELDEPSMLSIVETPRPQPSFSVRLDAPVSAPQPAPLAKSSTRPQKPVVELSAEELAVLEEQLEEEIAFRRAPEFEPLTLETTPIQANIIEFPRELVAPRKARPRLAEGPLREEAEEAPQLRIFEVEAEQIFLEEVVPQATGAPEWQSLLLENHQVLEHRAPLETQAQYTFEPQPAPLQRRVMAVVVDFTCLIAGLTLFATMAAYLCGPALLALKPAALAGVAGGTLVFFYLAYQMLFFTLSEATPGMRYARVALCTFSDENPSRKSMRRRTLANLLAACPLGLGYAWVLMDDDKLGWHDRISRMYQRAY